MKISIPAENVQRKQYGHLWQYEVVLENVINPQNIECVSFILEEDKAEKLNAHLDQGGSICVKTGEPAMQ